MLLICFPHLTEIPHCVYIYIHRERERNMLLHVLAVFPQPGCCLNTIRCLPSRSSASPKKAPTSDLQDTPTNDPGSKIEGSTPVWHCVCAFQCPNFFCLPTPPTGDPFCPPKPPVQERPLFRRSGRLARAPLVGFSICGANPMRRGEFFRGIQGKWSS